MPHPTATLLISCRDRPGLVAAVSEFIFRSGGNIIHADQHTDQEEGIFLQRVEWDYRDSELTREEIAPSFTPVGERFGMHWSLRFSDEDTPVAIMVSRQGHCLHDLLGRWLIGEMPGRPVVVISNHDDLRGVAEAHRVPFHHLPVTLETKASQEESARQLLDDLEVGLVVLARYMQILGPGLLADRAEHIINIHHSSLPAFAGARPYHQAHERGVKVLGATAHYVTAELDQGPIIEQDVARVSHRDTVGDMVRKGRDLEKVVLARAVRLHLEHRVIVYRNKTVVFD